MGTIGQFIALLLVIGIVGAYFWLIVVALSAVALVYFGYRWSLAERERVAELEAGHAAIGARADQQHNWVMQGDPRGTYGESLAPLM